MEENSDNRKRAQKSLSVKTFTISLMKNTKKYYNLDNIDGRDLFDVLKKDLSKFMDDYIIDHSKKNKPNMTCSIYRPKPSQEEPKPKYRFTIYSKSRLICGQATLGEIGVDKEIRAPRKKTSRYTDKDESVVSPFFFLIYIKGFVITEDIFPSVPTVVCRHILHSFVKQKLGEKLGMKIADFLQNDFVKTLVKDGFMQKVIMTYDTIPSEVCERMGILIKESDEFEFRLEMIAKKSSHLGESVKSKVNSAIESGFHTFFDGNPETWWFNDNAEIKVQAHLNDTAKTISLKNPFKFKPSYKIVVSLDDNFNSDYSDIKKQTFEFIKENVNPWFEFVPENEDKH